MIRKNSLNVFGLFALYSQIVVVGGGTIKIVQTRFLLLVYVAAHAKGLSTDLTLQILVEHSLNRKWELLDSDHSEHYY